MEETLSILPNQEFNSNPSKDLFSDIIVCQAHLEDFVSQSSKR